jgi:hypothetical protein
VAALAVVEDQVDELVDQVLGFLPVVEVLGQFLVLLGDEFSVSVVHILALSVSEWNVLA